MNDETTIEEVLAAAEAWKPYAQLLNDKALSAINDFQIHLRKALQETVDSRPDPTSHDMGTIRDWTLRSELGIEYFHDPDEIVVTENGVTWRETDDDDSRRLLSIRDILDADARRETASRLVAEAEARRADKSASHRLEVELMDRARLRALLEKYPDEARDI